MYFFFSTSNDPYFNIALEEYLFLNQKYKDNLIFIWINNPSVFIGKNQNPYQEINMEMLESQKIPLLRRISGGGTVYHDLGNINFSFIEKNISLQEINFLKHTVFLQNLLKSFGLNPTITTRKDLFIDNKKISGSAQCIKSTNSLYHSTLLFNSDLSNLKNLLLNKNIIQSKATLSKPNKVCNISDYLNINLYDFLDKCKTYLINNTNYNLPIKLNQEDLNHVKNISDEKYKSNSFVYEKTPIFKLNKIVLIDNVAYRLELIVKHWRIQSVSLSNNFNSYSLDKLIGCKFYSDSITGVLSAHYPNFINIIDFIF